MLDFSFTELYSFVLALAGMILAYLGKKESCKHCKHDSCKDCKHKQGNKKGHPRQW